MEPSCTRSAFGCHEGRKLLSHCSSSVTALCSGADLPQTSFSRFWSPYIKKLWQPSLSCQQVPENHQHRGDLAGGGLSLSGLPEAGQAVVCPPLPSSSPPPAQASPGSPQQHPRAPQGPPPAPAAPPRLRPLTSHNPAGICVYVCVSVCSPCWWLTGSPPEGKLCVSPHTGCVGCGSRPGLPSPGVGLRSGQARASGPQLG